MARKRKKKRSPESEKISKLVREGEPQDKAVAMALSMKRAGRLGPHGGYKRAGGRKRKRGYRRS